MSEPNPDEVAVLRARVATLEAQLAEQARATNAIVARSQEQLYWLERWHIDLNRVMSRPGAQHVLAVVKGARTTVRLARAARRKLSG